MRAIKALENMRKGWQSIARSVIRAIVTGIRCLKTTQSSIYIHEDARMLRITLPSVLNVSARNGVDIGACRRPELQAFFSHEAHICNFRREVNLTRMYCKRLFLTSLTSLTSLEDHMKT